MREHHTLKIIFLAAGLAGLLAFTGRREYRTEYSDVRHETAVVSDRYSRNAHSYSVQVVGQKATLHHSSISDRITFDGKIDFDVDADDISDHFNKNDSADVSYVEVYSAVYGNNGKDETRGLISRELTKYEFLGAVKK